MILKRYVLFVAIILVMLAWAPTLIAASGDTPSDINRPTPKVLEAITGAEGPKTLGEQVLDAVGEDSVVVESVDGRTVIMMEGESEDEFTLSFSDIVDGVAANVKLGKGGLNHRFTLVKPEGSVPTPIYLDIRGPAVNGGYGIKVILRF